MNEILNCYKLLKSRDLFIFLPILLFLFLLVSPEDDFGYIELFVEGHYTTYFFNTYLFIFLYKLVSYLNVLDIYLFTRLNHKQTKRIVLSFIFMVIISILLISYIAGWLRYGVSSRSINLLNIFICLQVIYIISAYIIYLQFSRKKNFVFIILPIALNFIFHYFLLPILI